MDFYHAESLPLSMHFDSVKEIYFCLVPKKYIPRKSEGAITIRYMVNVLCFKGVPVTNVTGNFAAGDKQREAPAVFGA